MNKKEILDILDNAKDERGAVPMRLVRQAFDKLPEPCEDTISRQAAIGEVKKHYRAYDNDLLELITFDIERLPPAQPGRYTEEELRVFKHGISLSLLSKRSSQHWRYDEDTATEIKFLERLYEKVGADMRGEQE